MSQDYMHMFIFGFFNTLLVDTVFVFVFVEFLVDLLAAPFQNGRRAP